MTTLSWQTRDDMPMTWFAESGEHKFMIVGGVQTFEGKLTLTIETYECTLGPRSLGQRSTLEAAQDWCQQICNNIPTPRPLGGEMHVWQWVNVGPDRRVTGYIYHDPRFDDGKKITTGNVETLNWDEEGEIAKTADGSIFRLCSPERTAELIGIGYAFEGEQKVIDGDDDIPADAEHPQNYRKAFAKAAE